MQCGASLTMCGTCCMCAATFTLDGPRVLGRSCLATGATVGWTVTKDRTPNRRQKTLEDPYRVQLLIGTPLPPIVRLQAHRRTTEGTWFPLWDRHSIKLDCM